MPIHFEMEMAKLEELRATMGAKVVRCAADALHALRTGDRDQSDAVIGRSFRIVRLGVEMEKQCIHVLALKNPLATDLRLVVSTLKVRNDLVRIAQQAGNIAEEVPALTEHAAMGLVPGELLQQGGLVLDMVTDCVNALNILDAETARGLRGRDDAVDQAHKAIQQEIEDSIREQPARLDEMIRYLKISRELERMADHAVSIGDDIVFTASGVLPQDADG
jgi:phosphate transport system protein